jgi:hypothetical protein
MDKSYTTERLNLIFEFIRTHGPQTNGQIADFLHLSYRSVQLATCQLEKEGLIKGTVNSFGGVYSNVSWRVTSHGSGSKDSA